MKRVVSVSIGSSQRDHKVELNFRGEDIIIERIGTDGNIQKAIDIIKELDGKIDAFGMGGIDVFVRTSNKKYIIKDSLPIKEAAKITPMVDGSGLKASMEKELPKFINDNIVQLKGKKVFILTAVDRYGMAVGFEELGCKLTIGDIIISLGLNIPIYSLKRLERIASIAAPIVCKLPFEMLYPTGKAQNKEERSSGKTDKYFHEADIIAGDFHYIKRHLPWNTKGKIVVTNTVTKDDVQWLKEKNIKTLITATPDLSGRSFGANVIEALAVAMIEKDPDDISGEDYLKFLDEINFKPRVIEFNEPFCQDFTAN